MKVRRGPLYMILAGAVFTVMVAAVKVARQEMGALDVVFWRATTSVPLALGFALIMRTGLRVRAKRVIVLRSALGFGAMFLFFTAAKELTLADLSIISKLQPILVAVIAPIALGAAEKAQRVVWLVLVFGLLGCALIIGPDLRVGSLYGVIALGATLCSAGAHVTVRALGKSEPAPVIVFWYQLLATVFALVVFVIAYGSLIPLPPSHLWPYLLGAGAAATLGQLLITRAYAIDQAAAVAAASYATVLFGFGADLLFFNDWPSWTVVAGGLLVVGGGLLLVFSRRPAPVVVQPGH